MGELRVSKNPLVGRGLAPAANSVGTATGEHPHLVPLILRGTSPLERQGTALCLEHKKSPVDCHAAMRLAMTRGILPHGRHCAARGHSLRRLGVGRGLAPAANSADAANSAGGATPPLQARTVGDGFPVPLQKLPTEPLVGRGQAPALR